MRFFKALTLSLFLTLPTLAQEADPYPDADLVQIKVGDVIDITPPGLLLQIICDKVDELIAVEIGEEQVVLTALAPGVTACSFYGQQDRDEYYEDQRSGVVEYRTVVKYVISAP